MNKKSLVLKFSILMVAVALICIIIANVSRIVKENNTINSSELYSEAIKYIRNNYDDSVEVKNSKDYKVFTQYDGLGTEKDGDNVYAYMWILAESYFVSNNNLYEGSGSSKFYKFTFKDSSIVTFESIEKDENYVTNLKKMINSSKILDKVSDYTSQLSNEDDIEEYYSYLLDLDVKNVIGEDEDDDDVKAITDSFITTKKKSTTTTTTTTEASTDATCDYELNGVCHQFSDNVTFSVYLKADGLVNKYENLGIEITGDDVSGIRLSNASSHGGLSIDNHNTDRSTSTISLSYDLSGEGDYSSSSKVLSFSMKITDKGSYTISINPGTACSNDDEGTCNTISSSLSEN